ncbi:MAG: tetratricopeptide repeat protein, partial [Usitatibacter sp.]
MPFIPAARSLWVHMFVAFTLVLAFAPRARAQQLESVEVVRRGDLAVIQARFDTTMRYVRHAPPDRGRLVKIELEATGPLEGPRRDGRITRRHPATDFIPAFLLTYAPETVGLTVEFREDVSFKVGGGADGRTIEIRVPVPKAARAAPPAPATAPPKGRAEPVPQGVAPATSAEVETQGARALAAARSALERPDLAAAIESLNRVLDLPPNRSSEEAQELIGTARERNGQLDKARVEYELYLKLYPAGAGAERVRARLAALGKKRTEEARAPRFAKAERSTWGSISSYHCSGNTKFDASTQPSQPTLPADQISLTSRDQSALITDINATTRIRAGDWEHRFSFRDTYSANFLAGQQNDNRLNTLSYEAVDRQRDILARLGRQSSPGVGVLGRFDGGWARIALVPGWRIGAVAGRPVEFFPSPEQRFFGASLDIGPFAKAWSGNLFAIEQRAEGFASRRAAGAELRYLDPVANGFALLDYDAGQHEINTLLVQANWNVTAAASANLLVDHRRAPTLQLSNAVFAHPGTTSIRTLIDGGISRDELWREAKAVTPISDLYSFGLTYRLGPRWQLGGDVKLQKVSATEAAGALPASPGTGNIWIYTLQGVGTSFWTRTDVFVASASAIRGALFDGWTLSGSY